MRGNEISGEIEDDKAKALAAYANALAKVLKIEDTIPAAVAQRAAFDPIFLRRLLAEQSTSMATSRVATEALAGGLPPWATAPTMALLISATHALARWAMTGFRSVPAEHVRQRLEACFACPALQTQGRRGVSARLALGSPAVCGLCHCAVAKKARLPTETCPMPLAEDPAVNRWGEPVLPPPL